MESQCVPGRRTTGKQWVRASLLCRCDAAGHTCFHILVRYLPDCAASGRRRNLKAGARAERWRARREDLSHESDLPDRFGTFTIDVQWRSAQKYSVVPAKILAGVYSFVFGRLTDIDGASGLQLTKCCGECFPSAFPGALATLCTLVWSFALHDKKMRQLDPLENADLHQRTSGEIVSVQGLRGTKWFEG